jgi:hypothetical protein
VPNETCTIFYSWQSQLPNSTNRGFIEKALEVSARAVREDATIDARPEVDQDTANVPGSPNIADVIRRKIDAAEVVICDVTIVQGLDGDGDRVRPTPNPNVLIELGYAMKSLGTTERLVLVMNTAYGGIEKLPFDLRQYRPTTYHLPESATNDEKAAQRKALASKLEATFRHVLRSRSRHTPTSLTVVDRLRAIPMESRPSVLLVYRPLNREDMPHEINVEFVDVDMMANVFHFKSAMGGDAPLDHRAPLSDVEDVWQPEPGSYLVRLSGYLGRPEPLKPYRYYSRVAARPPASAPEAPRRDTGVDDLMTAAAKHLMSHVTFAYVKAGYPPFETWWFAIPPGNETTGLELRGHRLIEERPARPGEMGWGLTDAGQKWVMSHRDR